MTFVTDNFVRANGALGANWATVVPNKNEFTGWGGTPQGNVLIVSNGVGPDATNGLDCAALWAGGQTFGNDQYAQATIKTVAAANAVLSITACVVSGANITFTYTVSSGSVASYISEGHLYVFVSGMQNAANNGGYASTTFGAGTFTAAVNAGNVNEAGSSGTGTVPSDCGCGVAVRLSGTSASTLNGYYFHVGTNSFAGDTADAGRKAYYELWKIVNGVGTQLIGDDAVTTLSRTTPSVGDIIGITAIGTQITAYYNGIVLTGGDPSTHGGVYQITDSSVTSGVPGITTFAVSGGSEYDWALWSSGSTQFGGNNGTTINNWQAGDISSTTSVLTTENFKENAGTWGTVDLIPYADGDLHTANANWVYEGASTFSVSSGVVRGGAGASLTFAYRSDISAPTSDQWSESIFTVTGNTSNSGPGVRIASGAQTGYVTQCRGNLLQLTKYVAGASTNLGNAVSQVVATGDSIRVTAIGTAISVYKNGVLVIGPVTDSAIASGNVGVFSSQSATDTGFNKWSGGSATELTAATNFIQDSDQYVGLNVTNGAFPIRPDVVRTWAQIFENTVTWPNDQYAQTTLTDASTLTSLRGPTVRSATGAGGYVFVTASSALVNLYKFVSGTPTLLKQTAYSPVLNDVFRIEVQGTLVTCKVNGNIIINLADTTIASGKPGLFWNKPGSGLKPVYSLSTFTAGNLGGFAVSGGTGIAGATVSYTGTASGSVNADGSGNYSIPSLNPGSYTITPSAPGYTFTPANSSQVVVNADISSVNFVAASNSGSGPFGEFVQYFGNAVD